MRTHIGIDLVDISAFIEQSKMPGTRFLGNFTALEISDAKQSAQRRLGINPSSTAEYESAYIFHLAGKWAAKEAFIKAWSNLLRQGRQDHKITQDQVHYVEIEVQKNKFGTPYLALHGKIKQLFNADLEIDTVSLSISHDGDYATAICAITACRQSAPQEL
jgi:holo-[acyl-carrier protein] synthase